MVDMNMSDTLISFETAKLAKEKGFQEKTWDYFYDSTESNIKFSCTKTRYPYNEKGYGAGVTTYIARPTQSLLQKWLRDIHEIVITIDFETIDDSEKAYTYTIYEWLPEGKNSCKDIWDFYETHRSMTQSSGWFPTYEEALEEALKEALNLI